MGLEHRVGAVNYEREKELRRRWAESVFVIDGAGGRATKFTLGGVKCFDKERKKVTECLLYRAYCTVLLRKGSEHK